MKKLSLVTLLFLCIAFNDSFAQFEGKIEVRSYEMEEGEKVDKDDSFILYITPDRILLQGEDSYKVGGQLNTEGVLVRHHEKDFVFLTGEKKAMKITKSGITSFMNMFGNHAKNEMEQDQKSGINFKNTGESKQVNGYSCEKFIFQDDENSDKRMEVWMTQDLDINWGILAEPWNENMKGFSVNELPVDLIFEKGYFPIAWQEYEGETLKAGSEVDVMATDLARSKVELASDIEVVSLQDYLFEQMRKNQ